MLIWCITRLEVFRNINSNNTFVGIFIHFQKDFQVTTSGHSNSKENFFKKSGKEKELLILRFIIPGNTLNWQVPIHWMVEICK